MAQKVSLDQFSLQQLSQLRQGFEGQINTLNQSLNQFRYALEKYEEGKRAIRAAEETKPTDEMLLPLSNALYIEGFMDNAVNGERVYLIQYGASYFVERNAKDATDLYSRKINLIKEKMNKLQGILSQKKDGYRQLEMRMMALIQQQQAQLSPK